MFGWLHVSHLFYISSVVYCSAVVYLVAMGLVWFECYLTADRCVNSRTGPIGVCTTMPNGF